MSEITSQASTDEPFGSQLVERPTRRSLQPDPIQSLNLPLPSAMASMTMAALVNTAVEDGGLNQVLELTTVNSKIVEKIKSEGVVNLVEFTNLWTKSEYEKETLEYRDEVDELKNNRVELDASGLPSSWHVRSLTAPPSTRRI